MQLLYINIMLKIDLHIHTIASGHAHCTIWEYIQQAKKLKMKTIGISEHGPMLRDALTSNNYFLVIGRIPEVVDNIRILKGAEANIINKKGEIDINNKVVDRLDYVMANLHDGASCKDRGPKLNTEAVINAINSGKVNIISHPAHFKRFKLDLDKVIEVACSRNVLLEINLSHVKKYVDRPMEFPYGIINLKKIVEEIKKRKKKIIIGTDSHNIWELGDISKLDKIKKEIGLTDNLIINNYPKELFKLLKIDEK